MAAVKADGYGHGAVPVSRALADAGVDSITAVCETGDLQEIPQLPPTPVNAPIWHNNCNCNL